MRLLFNSVDLKTFGIESKLDEEGKQRLYDLLTSYTVEKIVLGLPVVNVQNTSQDSLETLINNHHRTVLTTNELGLHW